MLRKIELVAAAQMLGITNAREIAEKIGCSAETVASYQSALNKSGDDTELARASINAASNRWQRKQYHENPAYRHRRRDQSRACRQRKKAA